MFKAKLKEGIKASSVQMADGAIHKIGKDGIIELPKEFYEEFKNGKNFVIVSEPSTDETALNQQEPPTDETVEMEEVKKDVKSGTRKTKKTTEMD